MAKPRVGMIGMGIMGSAMAANLMRAGFEVIGYDALAACRRRHRKAGGIVARNSGEVAVSANVTITSLPSAEALLQVANEIAKAKHVRKTIVETSTLPIPVKEAARRRLAAAGVTLLDCPLSGTGAQAKVKDLVVYTSGDTGEIKKLKALFAGFTRAVHYVGAFGNGSRMKYVANLLVAIHNVATAEAMVLGIKAGLPPQLIFDLIKTGAGNSRIFELRAPMMVKNDYGAPTMKIAVWQKDMDVIGGYARKIKVPTPMFDASSAIYTKARKSGYDDQDTAAVCAVLEKMAGVKRSRAKKR